jgi:hypothetical protein
MRVVGFRRPNAGFDEEDLGARVGGSRFNVQSQVTERELPGFGNFRNVETLLS